MGKYDWTDKRKFYRAIRREAAKGPDFAGRYAVIEWSCGSDCVQAIFADVVTGATHRVPFLGVSRTRLDDSEPLIANRADSRLMVVHGSLEMTYGYVFEDGPSGTFSFLWEGKHLRLLTCQISPK